MRRKHLLFAISIGTCFVLIIATAFFLIDSKNKMRIDKYQIQFAYPVSSINPTTYDDWESVFIGNHIYTRLLPENSRPWIPVVTDGVSISCQNQNVSYLSSNCKRIRISFHPKPFNDCNGRIYTVNDIKTELGMLLTAKAWILPHWQWCSEKTSLCLTSDWVPDVMRRLQNVEIRFGWSKSKLSDDVFGSGPYCLYTKWDKKNELKAGLLQPRKDNLPSIEFHVSESKDANFDLALYGSKNLLSSNKINLQTHTPLSFYVITSAVLAQYQLPWNTAVIKNTLENFLIKHEVLFPKTLQFVEVATLGGALDVKNKQKYTGSKILHFAIPDYLPNCPQLAGELNVIFNKNQNYAKAVCIDIVSYVVNQVQKNANLWDGFIVGISPIDPSRDAIKHQYFSPEAQGSWTYAYPHPEELYYQVGIGQSLVTVDKHKICGILPNPLGLGDLFITDLIVCKK